MGRRPLLMLGTGVVLGLLVGCGEPEGERPLPEPLPCMAGMKPLRNDPLQTRPADYHPGFTLEEFESDLPIIVIDTAGAEIVDEPKIAASLELYSRSDGHPNRLVDAPVQVEDIGIEIRGYSSQAGPKRQFGFEAWDDEGQERDAGFLGMPSASDWVLNGTFNDPSLLRNALAYTLARDVRAWVPQTRHVEVFVNQSGGALEASDYLGLYLLTERVDRSENRLAIPRNGEDMPVQQRSYLIEATRPENIWSYEILFCGPISNHHMVFVYPDDPSEEEYSWLEQYISDTELAMWRHDCGEIGDRIDLEVFADYVLLNELFQNVDGLIRSMFISKRGPDRLVVWPPWDFDLTLQNDRPLDAWYLMDRPWIDEMLHCAGIRALLAQRWQILRASA